MLYLMLPFAHPAQCAQEEYAYHRRVLSIAAAVLKASCILVRWQLITFAF